MPINVSCPHCGKQGRVPDKLGGTRIKCRSCDTGFGVPDLTRVVLAVPPPFPDDANSESAWLPNQSDSSEPSVATAADKPKRPSWKHPVVFMAAALPLMVIAAFLAYLAWPRLRASPDESSGAFGAAQEALSPLASHIAAKAELHVGAVVELTGPKQGAVELCADEAIFLKYRPKTTRFGPDKDKEVFGVYISDLAMVLSVKQDRLQVRVLEGQWENRVGWIARDQVRLVPSPQDLAGNVVERINLGKRREIYGELYRLIALASFEADHRFPSVNFDSSPGSFNKYMNVCESLKKAAPKSIIEKYRDLGIDEMHLDRINVEGMKSRWPVPEVPDPYDFWR